jgi:uncharacterized protein YdeI (YjbR/CyaY-like superfamily)
MGFRDPRVDSYISEARPFAQPILRYIRELVHHTCPEVEETLKWRMPTFMYHGILAGMGAFKERAMFGFWKGALITGEKGRTGAVGLGEMGDLTSVADLPPKRVIVSQIKQAMRLNEDGTKLLRKRSTAKPVQVPPDLKTTLGRNRQAASAFEAFSPSHRREYVEWITEAKTDETRQRRLAQAVEWIAEGKPRNWKYMKR